MKIVKWYKYGLFWRRGDGDEDMSSQDRDDGTIDLIYNTLSKICKDKDTSTWAFRSFYKCAYLLRAGERYPAEFSSTNEVNVWWMYYVRKFLLKLGLPIKWKYRSRMDITRDPYKALLCLYTQLYGVGSSCDDEDLTEMMVSIDPPKKIWRGSIVKLWNQIIFEDNREHFVKRLSYWEARTYVNWYEKQYANNFYDDKN